MAILYFGLIAAPVYRSTASIVVSNPKQGASTLAAMLSGVGGDGSHDGAYILKAQVGSWSAFRTIQNGVALARKYADGDGIGRFGGLWTGFRTNYVALWHYFQTMVHVDVDDRSGIVTLEADGYDPVFAHAVASRLLADAVQHMDRMRAQQEDDHVRIALSRKAELEADLRRDEAAIAALRTASGVYDPKERYTSDLTLANATAMKETELVAQRAAAAAAAANSPAAPAIDSSIAAVRRQRGGDRAFGDLSRSAARYDQLTVKRDTDIALLNQASLAAQQAQLNAVQDRYYLNIVSAPSQPATPELPNRLRWIGIVLLVTLLLWGLLR